MLLSRYIKSWRSTLIVILLVFSAFCVLLVFTSMKTQWMAQQENEQLKSYQIKIEEWKKCMENTNIYTIDGEKYSKLSEIQGCNNTHQ